MIADVHGDYVALRAALAHLDQLGCSEILCAGDLIDYGNAPDKTIALLRKRGIACARGNHDFVDDEGRDAEGRFLSPRSHDFIDALQPTLARTIVGVRVAVWHARPGDRMRGIIPGLANVPDLLEAAEADVLIVGHTHLPMNISAPEGSIVNPGSLLREPPAGDQDIPATGTFGVMELPSRIFRAFRVEDGTEVPLARIRGRGDEVSR